MGAPIGSTGGPQGVGPVGDAGAAGGADPTRQSTSMASIMDAGGGGSPVDTFAGPANDMLGNVSHNVAETAAATEETKEVLNQDLTEGHIGANATNQGAKLVEALARGATQGGMKGATG